MYAVVTDRYKHPPYRANTCRILQCDISPCRVTSLGNLYKCYIIYMWFIQQCCQTMIGERQNWKVLLCVLKRSQPNLEYYPAFGWRELGKENSRTVPQIRLLPLHSTSFPVVHRQLLYLNVKLQIVQFVSQSKFTATITVDTAACSKLL